LLPAAVVYQLPAEFINLPDHYPHFMSTGSHELFYNRLPVNQLSLGELLTEEHLFYRIPENWHVLLTDVKGSTRAVTEGKHETVNLVATGSMVAVLNIAYKQNISIPFFFGGDGATFLVPPVILEPVLKALLQYQQNTAENFALALRVGHVPVEDIYKNGCHLTISKLKTSDLFSIPVALGNGLAWAEKIIKGDDYLLAPLSGQDALLDMSGFECSWDRIKPPEQFDEVVSLLVLATNAAKQAPVFKKVADVIDTVYGDPEKRKPITESQLKLKRTLQKIGNEMRGKFGRYNLLYLAGTWMKLLLGPFYFKTRAGKTYLKQLVQLSDTLVIDGRIGTVISGTPTQRSALITALDGLEAGGEIVYGLYVSKESVLSCYVRNRNEKHVHFVDGADGGYTRAAMMLKQKLALA
jgi:hypothetical protein